ncbi:MAG: protein kinase, partial [Dokdonella sp.]
MIEIPGYRLLRQLGRGGMATVYLAIQESVDREVALKIMSPALLVDASFGERFLREAKIAARLHHRHVVGIHDVGRHDDYHYIAMEYLAGGPLLGKEGLPRPVEFALRIT